MSLGWGREAVGTSRSLPASGTAAGAVCELQEDWWLGLEPGLQLLEAELQAGVGLGFSSEMCRPLTLRPGCGVRAQCGAAFHFSQRHWGNLKQRNDVFGFAFWKLILATG